MRLSSKHFLLWLEAAHFAPSADLGDFPLWSDHCAAHGKFRFVQRSEQLRAAGRFDNKFRMLLTGRLQRR